VEVPAIEKAHNEFKSVEQAFELALNWEKAVTGKINDLMAIAIEEKDYASQDFLRWFVTEQVEEEATMSHLVTLAKGLGERSIFMLENLIGQM
jgi:ferritin